MHFNLQLFKVSIIQTKLFGPLDFELSRFHCTVSIYKMPVSFILSFRWSDHNLKMTTSDRNLSSAGVYNGTYNNEDLYRRYMLYMDMAKERQLFRYFYHVFAVLILVPNVFVVVAICASRKQRRHFRNWLIIHMTVIHILFGGIVCPFLGQHLVESYTGLGLNMVTCKLFHFASDTLSYMSSVSIGILGVYQTSVLCSPRMLNGVSHTLLTAIMIVIPWLVVIMLTAVLRLTMSVEHFGECYKIDDTTAQVVWTILAYGMPLLLVSICLASVIIVAVSPFMNTAESSPPGRRNIIVFISVCLTSCLVMRTPFYFVYSEPLSDKCIVSFGALVCQRLKLTLDQFRLASMVLIPVVYLVPTEIKRGLRKFRSSCCKSDCSSAKKQSVELTDIHSSERMIA